MSGHRGDTCFRKKRKIHDIYFTFSKTNLSRARKERERERERRRAMSSTTRERERVAGERNVWDVIVNNDDICFKHILPRLNQTDIKFLYDVNSETRALIKTIYGAEEVLILLFCSRLGTSTCFEVMSYRLKSEVRYSGSIF